MSKICELFGLDYADAPTNKKHKDLCSIDYVGVEVEVEDAPITNVPGKLRNYMVMENDGSLRNDGREFKFRGPLAGSDVVLALSLLQDLLSSTNATCNDRTGLHVHVDVRDLTPQQLVSFVILYLIFEDVLFEICGKDRETNIFCSSVSSCEGAIEQLVDIVSEDRLKDGYAFVGQDQAKYTSVNIQNIPRLGTVEFRGHKGTYDTSEILLWINLLLSMKCFARSFEGTPNDIVLGVSEHGATEFTRMVFGEYSPVLEKFNLLDGLFNGVRLAQDVLYMKNLTKTNKSVIQAAKRKSKNDKDLFLESLKKKGRERLIEYYQGQTRA
jgi:hypothetical protein